jgi:hypothetical protein
VITILTQSEKCVQIQFYVNNSIIPYYECEGFLPHQTLRCSSPFDEPFFARISSPAGNVLSLKIEYTVTYSSQSANGCRLSQIPTMMAIDGEKSSLQPQNQCVTLVQEAMHVVLKCVAFLTVIFMIAVFFQRLGYWNFCEWKKLPGEAPVVKTGLGMIAVEASITAARMAVFGASFIGGVDSDSSELSQPIGEKSLL